VAALSCASGFYVSSRPEILSDVATDDSGTWNDHTKMKTCTSCGGEGETTSMVANEKGETKPVKGPCVPCGGKGTV
jgi:DnaJ-class molecular chaperone